MDYYELTLILSKILKEGNSITEKVNIFALEDICEKINDNRKNYAYCMLLFNKLLIEFKYILNLENDNDNMIIREYFYNTDVSENELKNIIDINKNCTEEQMNKMVEKCHMINLSIFGYLQMLKFIDSDKQSIIKTTKLNETQMSSFISKSKNIDYYIDMMEYISEV